MSLLLFKELVKKYREEIENEMLSLCKYKIGRKIVLEDIEYEEKKEYFSYLRDKYRSNYLLIHIYIYDFVVDAKFSINNFINRILSEFNCKVSDIEEFKKHVFKFFLKETFQKPKDCFESVVCLYFKDFFKKYGIYLEEERKSILKNVSWDLYKSKYGDYYFLLFSVSLSKFKNFLELNEDYLKESIKKFMDELFLKRNDERWWDIFKNYMKSDPFLNFYKLDKDHFIQKFSELISEYFIEESNIFKIFATGKRELIKINEEVKVFIEKLVLEIRKFRNEIESGDIINFVLKNNKLRENISKIVFDYCKKEDEKES